MDGLLAKVDGELPIPGRRQDDGPVTRRRPQPVTRRYLGPILGLRLVALRLGGVVRVNRRRASATELLRQRFHGGLDRVAVGLVRALAFLARRDDRVFWRQF